MLLTFQAAGKTAFHLALGLLLLVFAIGYAGASRADDITLAVASNFINTAKQLAADFEAHSDHRVTLAVGSTGAHYAQIRHGAPFDIFFAADAATPKRLEQENRIIHDSRFTYAQGQLVLWSLDAALVDKTGKLLEPEMLKKNPFAHLAIANPRLAPYGLAAQQTLTNLGVFDSLQNKLVRGENVGQTYQFIHSGAAALGFVSLAQIIGQDKNNEGSYWLVPQDLYSPIEQQAVLLTDKKAARDFLSFVRSDAGKTVIRTHGYRVVD